MGTPADLSEEPAIHIDPIEAPTTPPVPNEKKYQHSTDNEQ